MRLNGRTRVAFPRPVVFRAYRDELPRVVPFLGNVESIVVEQRQDEGTRSLLVNLWRAKGDIPAVAQRFLKPEMLAWTDRARWDEADLSCQWEIQAHALPGVVECTGRTIFHERGGETEVEVDGELTLHLERMSIPRLFIGAARPVVEKIIVTALTPNLVATGTAVEKYLRSRQQVG